MFCNWEKPERHTSEKRKVNVDVFIVGHRGFKIARLRDICPTASGRLAGNHAFFTKLKLIWQANNFCLNYYGQATKFKISACLGFFFDKGKIIDMLLRRNNFDNGLNRGVEK
jgi:hypothetical protein